jgi:hypothetical protein
MRLLLCAVAVLFAVPLWAQDVGWTKAQIARVYGLPTSEHSQVRAPIPTDWAGLQRFEYGWRLPWTYRGQPQNGIGVQVVFREDVAVRVLFMKPRIMDEEQWNGIRARVAEKIAKRWIQVDAPNSTCLSWASEDGRRRIETGGATFWVLAIDPPEIPKPKFPDKPEGIIALLKRRP